MSRVALKNVAKSFGPTCPVDELTLDIHSGEFLVLLGPSGCGKSTLLRLIAGLETLDSGEIHIGDRRVDHLAPGERGVAMVFQNYALYPHMTVYGNLAFGLRNARVPEPEVRRRAEEAGRLLEIDALLDRRPDQLSGGQRQRVAIARAIVKEPELFLFDEPLSNLDAALRTRTRVELAQLHHRLGATMIFVTHDQIEAMTMADRIVVLNDGQIEQIGAPMEVYHRPATRFVAEFVGSPSMNILPCVVTAGDDGYAHARIEKGPVLETRIPAAALGMGAHEIGLRPEFLRLTSDDGDFAGEARMVERLGERTLLHVDLDDGTRVIGEDSGISYVHPGDRVALKARAEMAHLFDAQGRAHHAERS